MNRTLRYLRQVVAGGDGDGVSDGQLLEQYLCRQDAAAFEMLVRRHGPMVLGVCRRILANSHDAEDAFQATFLVLVRRAAAVRPRDRVGHWLYGVARRTALKARTRTGRQQAREQPLVDGPAPAAEDTDVRELRRLLDVELSRLPAKYRQPLLLCDLEGQTRKEVALHLGWPEGTVATRLHQARKLLARRLGRLGLGITAGTLAAVLPQVGQAGAVPPALVAVTVQGARLFAVHSAAAAEAVSGTILSLAQEVLKTMMLMRMKMLGLLLLALVLAGSGAGLALQAALGAPQESPSPVVRGEKQKVDPTKDEPKGNALNRADANPTAKEKATGGNGSKPQAGAGAKPGPGPKKAQPAPQEFVLDLGLTVPAQFSLAEALNAEVTLKLNDIPLHTVMKMLRETYDMNVLIDKEALKGDNLDLDAPINLQLAKVPFRVGLRHILRQVGTSYMVEDNILIITSRRGKLVRRVYVVEDLVGKDKATKDPAANNLIKLIVRTVEPESWGERGGQGTIDCFRGNCLVVNHFPAVQEEVEMLLEALRNPSSLPPKK